MDSETKNRIKAGYRDRQVACDPRIRNERARLHFFQAMTRVLGKDLSVVAAGDVAREVLRDLAGESADVAVHDLYAYLLEHWGEDALDSPAVVAIQDEMKKNNNRRDPAWALSIILAAAAMRQRDVGRGEFTLPQAQIAAAMSLTQPAVSHTIGALVKHKQLELVTEAQHTNKKAALYHHVEEYGRICRDLAKRPPSPDF